MDKKIIKYKLKKNNLKKKIFDILNYKKEQYEDDIINSNDNDVITSYFENFFNNMKLNLSNNLNNQMFIIVSGTYFVGKTTFINHLENYIKILEKITHQKIETNLVVKLFIGDNDKYFKNIEFNVLPQITIIECNNNIVDKLNFLIQSKNIINIMNINIIPKNEFSLKNKLINKIIYDIKNKSDEFIQFICNFQIQEKNNICDKINLLKVKFKNNILVFDDFIFLDNIVNLYYYDITNNSNNFDKLLNINIFYL